MKTCNCSALIDKKIANKFFYRETQTTLADTPAGRKFQEKLEK